MLGKKFRNDPLGQNQKGKEHWLKKGQKQIKTHSFRINSKTLLHIYSKKLESASKVILFYAEKELLK